MFGFTTATAEFSEDTRCVTACASPILHPAKVIDAGVASRHCTGDASSDYDGAAIRSPGATRRDLLLETLALRHQLSILASFEEALSPR